MRCSRERGAAGWLSPSERLRISTAIREAKAADPKATVEQLSARTGASEDFIGRVLRHWKRKGRAA